MLACALLLACAGQAAASTGHDMTGTWSCCGPGGASAQTWTITTMDKASGNFSGTGQGGSIQMNITGNVSGDAVTLTTAYVGMSYSATFKGTLTGDSKKMSGSWESSSSQKGTWTATRPSAPTPGDPNSPDPNVPEAPNAKAIPGDIYVVDSAVNNGLGALYKVNPENGQSSIVHVGAPFTGVRGVAFGPEGNLFLTDIGAHAILKLDLKTGAVTRVTGVNEPLLGAPWGIVYEPGIGDFLVTDSVQGTVVRVDPKTGAVKRIYNNNGGAPHGIALEPGGPAYVTDFKFHGVLKLVRSGNDWNYSVFKKGPFIAPEGIAPVPTAAGTRFYVADTAAPGGTEGLTAAGGSGGLFSWTGAAAADVLFTPRTSGGVVQIPTALAQSSDGKTLFIGSNDGLAGKGAIAAMNLADGKLRTLAGGFSLPSGIAVAPPKRVEVKVNTGGKGTTATPNGVTTTVTSPQQPVAATVAVAVNVPGGFRAGASASKAVRAKTVTKTVPAGKRGTKIRVPFKPALRRSIKAAQQAGKKVKAKVTITATAGNGASRKVVKRVPIKSAGA